MHSKNLASFSEQGKLMQNTFRNNTYTSNWCSKTINYHTDPFFAPISNVFMEKRISSFVYETKNLTLHSLRIFMIIIYMIRVQFNVRAFHNKESVKKIVPIKTKILLASNFFSKRQIKERRSQEQSFTFCARTRASFSFFLVSLIQLRAREMRIVKHTGSRNPFKEAAITTYSAQTPGSIPHTLKHQF